MKKLFRSKLTAKTTMLIGIATLIMVAGTVLGFSAKTVLASDCSPNAIMHCGTSSPRNFISKINAGTQPDLKTIYASYGLAPSEYSEFVTSARPGTAFKDGTIRVNGRIVATGAQSIGRSHFSYAHAKVIGSHTYWESRAQDVFQSNTIPVMVLFNAKGQMQFAVMYDCGNPTNGHPNNPTFACNNLFEKQLNRTTYQFHTSASAGNGATINHVVYDFGDGQTKTEANPATVVDHTYAHPGNYTAKVTVFVNVPGSQTYAIAAAGECVKHITVAAAPVAACTLLNATIIDRNQFRLTATASTANGATISAYNFMVKDGSGHAVASPVVHTSELTASTNVDLPIAGTYHAAVTVTTSVGARTSDACETTITVAAAPVATCKQLTVAAIDRTNFTLNASATASNGATIQGYDFVVKNAQGSVVSSKAVNSAALTAATNVALNDAGTYQAQVTVRSSLGQLTGPQCLAPITVTPAAAPGVTITKHVDNVKEEQVAVGQIFNYELVVTNTGNVDLVNAIVTDTPPAGVTLLTADKGSIANNKWSYTIPSLKIGEHANFNLTAKVPAHVDGNLVNTACVNAVEVNPGQPNENDACDTATVHVPPVVPTNPNITITKTVDGQKSKQVNVGQNFVYQLVVKNTGQIDLKDVAVTDVTPNGVTLISADLGSIANNNWSYTIPNLAVDQSVTINITAKVATYVPGSLVNTACVNAPEVNPTHPNDNDACDTASVTVTPPATPAVLGAVAPPTVLPNTGAGNVVALFAGVTIAGTIAGRLFLSRKLGRNS